MNLSEDEDIDDEQPSAVQELFTDNSNSHAKFGEGTANGPHTSVIVKHHDSSNKLLQM